MGLKNVKIESIFIGIDKLLIYDCVWGVGKVRHTVRIESIHWMLNKGGRPEKVFCNKHFWKENNKIILFLSLISKTEVIFPGEINFKVLVFVVVFNV